MRASSVLARRRWCTLDLGACGASTSFSCPTPYLAQSDTPGGPPALHPPPSVRRTLGPNAPAPHLTASGRQGKWMEGWRKRKGGAGRGDGWMDDGWMEGKREGRRGGWMEGGWRKGGME
eukprot:2710246-Rhodomonas_salina.1